MISIDKVQLDEKQVLRNLMQLYKYDFTEYDPEDLDLMGLYDYPYLDYYFVESDRYAYFIRFNGVLAGFALVRYAELELTKETVLELVEFFVLKKYRREGIGSYAARDIVSKHSGKWKIGVISSNVPALSFWRKIIHTKVGVSHEEIKENSWDGTILVFETK
ncbi:GNAT family N-acetyltransferase [Myroides marinus]|uniref:GNAT family N-acetyltransferase n=1 Tax=Myroides marinus TaxID=703342 RepID=UPI002578C699|nr:GNAT family N-acetyltransferase [Myroides marinus]MDM1362391.1 GNAT family N-acetyltransferase [Myroides marinus]MDM1369732.1 GNAT family N-acetyltransferase [Myroides marinus]MDM1376744.1 GNAT family N-acetyltransferase [Myroides marinus]MDM1384097.1 GNAT family N-acetyltransferase [Myroides marinus]